MERAIKAQGPRRGGEGTWRAGGGAASPRAQRSFVRGRRGLCLHHLAAAAQHCIAGKGPRSTAGGCSQPVPPANLVRRGPGVKRFRLLLLMFTCLDLPSNETQRCAQILHFSFLHKPVLFAYAVAQRIQSRDGAAGNCRQPSPFDTEVPVRSHGRARAFKEKMPFLK